MGRVDETHLEWALEGLSVFLCLGCAAMIFEARAQTKLAPHFCGGRWQAIRDIHTKKTLLRILSGQAWRRSN